MTRLSIIDLSASAHQPMRNQDGSVWIVYNGETYNYVKERQQLEQLGYSFHSSSDTEVVLRMYEHYGDDFLSRVRGIFALAIYDSRGGVGNERLLLARDHLGVKPLLYTWNDQKLVFASEMKGLLASGLVAPDIDPVSLKMLLSFGSVFQPRTIIQNVYMLMPGHRMIIEPGGHRIERYWTIATNRFPGIRQAPYEEQVREIARVLDQTVQMQMVSDVPIGAFLSGGIDSSILVALMARAAGRRIKTFSVGFEEEGSSIDESRIAAETAAYLGTDHYHVLVKGQDVRDRITHIAYSLDQPSVDGVNSYFISWAARQAVTVSISGTGGDELFAGYPWFRQMVLYEHYRRGTPLKSKAIALLGWLAARPMFDRYLLSRGGPLLTRFRVQQGFLQQYANQYNIFGEVGSLRLMLPDLEAAAHVDGNPSDFLALYDRLPAGTTIERMTGLCLQAYTGNQLLRDIDAVSMAHSLEVRVPYLDPVMVQLALSLPDSSKLAGYETLAAQTDNPTYRSSGAKKILIDAGRSLLPADFDVQPKRGFSMPFDQWLRGPLHEVLADTLAEERIRRRGLLNPIAVASVRESFLEGRISWARPWLLMILELWFQEILDKTPGPKSAWQ